MPELGTYGSVRGVPSNGHPYRDRCAARTGRLAVDNAHALPTAPAFAHKLHSLLPPPTTRTQSPSGPGSIGAATILTRGGRVVSRFSHRPALFTASALTVFLHM